MLRELRERTCEETESGNLRVCKGRENLQRGPLGEERERGRTGRRLAGGKLIFRSSHLVPAIDLSTPRGRSKSYKHSRGIGEPGVQGRGVCENEGKRKGNRVVSFNVPSPISLLRSQPALLEHVMKRR